LKILVKFISVAKVMVDTGQDVVVRVAERKTDLAAASSSSAHAPMEDDEAVEEEEEDCWADMLEGTSYPELFSPGGCIKKDVGAMSPRLYQQGHMRDKNGHLFNDSSI
jgi:hypothetical protein